MLITYCVPHLNELGEIVKPACCCHLEEKNHILVQAQTNPDPQLDTEKHLELSTFLTLMACGDLE